MGSKDLLGRTRQIHQFLLLVRNEAAMVGIILVGITDLGLPLPLNLGLNLACEAHTLDVANLLGYKYHDPIDQSLLARVTVDFDQPCPMSVAPERPALSYIQKF